ncbi:MAG: aminoglycoside phosphotransferase family protein [Pseudomonadota bacterium]
MEVPDRLTRDRLRDWKLTLLAPVAKTVNGTVWHVRQENGQESALKVLTEMGRRFEGTAADVLRAFDGHGMVRLLRASPDALLLEWCEGPQLLQATDGHQDRVAIPILIDIVRRLRRQDGPRPGGVPSLADRCTCLRDGDAGLPEGARPLIAAASRCADSLLATVGEERLLHGDLHHANVLRTDRDGRPVWVAIDPQAIWGDPAYDVANLFGNPRDFPEITLQPDRAAKLADTLSQDLGLPRNRVMKWAFVHSCIAAVWSIEDGEDPECRLDVARMLWRLV